MSWTTIDPKIEEFKKVHQDMKQLLVLHIFYKIAPLVIGALLVGLGYYLAWVQFNATYNIVK